jgi:eukaryotic-like serine/threonine-protein kinase
MTTGGPPHTLVDGRYELRRPLGRGGMGVVWEAYDNRLGRHVAVKELLFRGAMDAETQAQWVERARREARAIARIGHEHVVAVHDVIEAEGQVWIVMEQVNPHSLADHLREQGRLPALQTARIGLEVLRGLRAVHAAGVLHRDVKPHNILFRRDGRAVLMDFGIATFEGAAQVTRVHETVGTPQYLAPELARPGMQAVASPAADLWSLGVTLYEAAEGRAPFRGPTPYEVLEAVRASPVPPMAHAGPLRPLIEGLLVKDPHERLTAERAEQLLQHVSQETPPHPLANYPRTTQQLLLTRGPYAPERDGDTGSADLADTDAGDADADTADSAAAPQPGPVLSETPRPRRSRRRKVLALVAGAAALTVLVAGGWFAVARMHTSDSQALADSDIIRRANERGFLVVGVKSDQPGLSEQKTAGSEDFQGFDIDLARAIADHLGFATVRFTVVDTPSREYQLSSGKVDLVVASYSITDERRKVVDFAGPYYIAGQDFLVRDADKNLKGPDDLRKVCTVQGSTSQGRLSQQYPGITQEPQSSYGRCVNNLLAGSVDAVSTDDVILAGYRAQHPKQLRLLGSPSFGLEDYGVGLRKQEPALKAAVCAAIKADISSGRWQRSYDRYLKPLGLSDPLPPTLSECP